MLAKSYPYYLANEPVAANEDLAVTDKYTGEVATRVALADARAIDAAIGRAVQVAEPMRSPSGTARDPPGGSYGRRSPLPETGCPDG